MTPIEAQPQQTRIAQHHHQGVAVAPGQHEASEVHLSLESRRRLHVVLNVDKCVEQEIDPYIAGSRERHNQPLGERMKAPPECPAEADAVTAMKYRMQTAEGKAIYSKRKATVETVFGVIKEVLGFRRFHLRGLRGAEGEWNLVCMGWNLKRMHALAGG